MRMHPRYLIAASGLVLGAALTAVLWSSRDRPSTPGATAFEASSRSVGPMELREWQRDERAKVAMHRLDDADQNAASLEALIDRSIADPGRVLNPQMRSDLAGKIADHLLARAEASSDAYMALVEREPMRFLRPDDDDAEWAYVQQIYSSITDGRQARRDDARGALRTSFEHVVGEAKGRLVAVGTGRRGMRIDVTTGRDYAAITQGAAFDIGYHLPDITETRYWIGGGGGSPPSFRLPLVSLRQEIDKHGAVVAAQSLLMVENAEGRRFPIRTVWYWVQDHSQWCAERMMVHGAGSGSIVF